MWQDSGRYEWPLIGEPVSTAIIPFVQTQIQEGPGQVVTVGATRDAQALVINPYDRWYDPHRFTTAGNGGIVIDTRLDPEQANGEIAALRHQVEELKAENCDLLIGHAELTRRLNELRARVAELEQGGDGRTL